MSEEERSERVAYVQALLEYARDDARQVYIRVTAALAVATLFVTQIPFKNLQALSQGWTWALYVGLALLLAAAIVYFIYVGDTHHARPRIAKYLVHPEAVVSEGPTQPDPVEAILTNLWRSRKWWAFYVANSLFAVGGIILTAVLYKMIASPILPS
jgi:uncharacterized membrane protein YkvI